jgi:hypothetical protein
MPVNVYASLLLPFGVVDVATFWIFSPHCTFVFLGSIIVDIGGNVCQPRIGFNRFVIILSCVVRNHVEAYYVIHCTSNHIPHFYSLLHLDFARRLEKNSNFDFEFSSSSISSSIRMHLKVSHIIF